MALSRAKTIEFSSVGQWSRGFRVNRFYPDEIVIQRLPDLLSVPRDFTSLQQLPQLDAGGEHDRVQHVRTVSQHHAASRESGQVSQTERRGAFPKHTQGNT